MGVKPPKKWRDMGVGRVEGGGREGKPMWKGRRGRGLVGESVQDGGEDEVGGGWEEGEGILPVVGGEEGKREAVRGKLAERL